uniref:Uncharacterized protein n=1 Tax=Rhizophora mucronata TaxID=61149 RepID=A0A2P2QZS4_RHIMU
MGRGPVNYNFVFDFFSFLAKISDDKNPRVNSRKVVVNGIKDSIDG